MLPQLARSGYRLKKPLNIRNIKDTQEDDPELQRMLQKIPNSYFVQHIGHIRDVICYVKPGENKNENWKIALPRQLLKPTVKWFHLVAGHLGEKRLEQTIKARYVLQSKLANRNFQVQMCCFPEIQASS